MQKSTISIFIIFLLLISSSSLFSQDTVVKVNGERILAKVIEVGLELISYKKLELKDSPTFNENKKEIAYIRFANGSREDFQNAGNAKIESGNSTGSNGTSSLSTSTANPQGEKQKPLYHMERIGTKYFVNGEKIKRKEAESLMKKSSNPAVGLTLKTAKAMRISQKIVKVTSFPAIPAGIIGFIASISNTVKASKDGGATFQNYAALGSTFIGTISFPIANKILKKKTNKLSDKAIDLYNMNN